MKQIAIALILLTLLSILSLAREMLFKVLMTFVKHDTTAVYVVGCDNSSISEPYFSTKTNQSIINNLL